MPRPHFALLAVGFAVLVIGAVPTPAAGATCAPNDTICQQLADAKQSQANASQRLQQIEQSLADAQTKANQTLAVVDQLNAQVAAAQAKVAQTQTRIQATTRQIGLTDAEISRQEARLQARQALLDQRVRLMDEHGSTDYMELVVTSRNFNELVDRLALVQTIIESDQRLVDSVRQQRDQVKRLRQTLQGEHDQEATLLRQQRDQQAQVERTRATQQGALAYYQQLAAQLDAQRTQLEAEKAKIDALVNRLQTQFDAEARQLGGGSGRFAWPERGPITQPFGCTTLLGEPYDPACPTLHFHTGIDIAANFGTPIGAADAGVVSFINTDGWGGGYGNYVIITHGNGFATL